MGLVSVSGVLGLFAAVDDEGGQRMSFLNECIDSAECFVALFSLEIVVVVGLLGLAHALIGLSAGFARRRHRKRALKILHDREVSE